MKKLLTFFAATLFASSALSATNLANITGYDLTSSYPDGTSGLTHTYTGDITPGTLFGIFDYTNGTGTLTDGQIQNSGAGHLFFGNSASITLFLDDDYYVDDISFFSALGKSSSLQSATINGEAISSSPFGQIVFGNPQDDLFDLSGTALENVAINQITLSDFGLAPFTPNLFTLSEIQVTGTLVSAIPEPSTYALMLGGLGLVGFMAVRRRRKLV